MENMAHWEESNWKLEKGKRKAHAHTHRMEIWWKIELCYSFYNAFMCKPRVNCGFSQTLHTLCCCLLMLLRISNHLSYIVIIMLHATAVHMTASSSLDGTQNRFFFARRMAASFQNFRHRHGISSTNHNHCRYELEITFRFCLLQAFRRDTFHLVFDRIKIRGTNERFVGYLTNKWLGLQTHRFLVGMNAPSTKILLLTRIIIESRTELFESFQLILSITELSRLCEKCNKPFQRLALDG